MTSNLSERVSNLVYKIDAAHVNSPDVILWLEEIKDLLLFDDKLTIDFLNNCSDRKILYWICPLFQDIAMRFLSNSLSECLLFLIKRYPENNELPINVQRALEINKAWMSDEAS